jgi:hypothetical protein
MPEKPAVPLLGYDTIPKIGGRASTPPPRCLSADIFQRRSVQPELRDRPQKEGKDQRYSEDTAWIGWLCRTMGR